jgi:hypothetical protein
MKPELDRLKSDVETIQRAMGLAPSFRREWIRWMRRDGWSNLWWCLPGVIALAAALLPADRTAKFLGLVLEQWAGILVTVALLGVTWVQGRRINGKDGRPEGMVREARRIHGLSGQGLWFGLAAVVQLLLFFVWSKQHQVAFEPFWAGLFILLGSTCLVVALSARTWVLLGYAIPFTGYGLCLPLVGDHHAVKAVLLGLMFIGIALSFSLIQAWEIRRVQQQPAP